MSPSVTSFGDANRNTENVIHPKMYAVKKEVGSKLFNTMKAIFPAATDKKLILKVVSKSNRNSFFRVSTIFRYPAIISVL